MADSMKDVWQKFKSDINGVNEKSRENRAKINSDFKNDVIGSKNNMKKNSANKNMMMVWGLIMMIPLAVIAVVLLVMFGLLIWDIFFGL